MSLITREDSRKTNSNKKKRNIRDQTSDFAIGHGERRLGGPLVPSLFGL